MSTDRYLVTAQTVNGPTHALLSAETDRPHCFRCDRELFDARDDPEDEAVYPVGRIGMHPRNQRIVVCEGCLTASEAMPPA